MEEAKGKEIKESFEIPDLNFEKFRSKIAHLAKRAERLGFQPIGYVEIGTSYKKMKAERSTGFELGFEPPSILMHHVEVYGERPHIKGWRFVGKLEHMPGVNEVLVKELTEGDVPSQYRACEPNCDHCHTNRLRSNTFVIQNLESKEYMQIGRSCLGEYFGGKEPEAVAALFELLQSGRETLRDLEDWGEEGVSVRSMYFEPRRVLEYAVAAVRADGRYISTAVGEEECLIPTGHLVRTNLTIPTKDLRKDEKIEVTEQDKGRAQEILDWLASESVASKEETYFHNLRVMTQADAVGYRNIGLYASAVAAYQREIDKRLEREAAASSEYVGTKDEKVDAVVTLVGVKTIPGGRFGDKLLYRFVDEQGNLMVWFCSGRGPDMVVGNTYKIRGTVKEHEEYRGVKQTILERVNCPDLKIFPLIESYGGDLKAFTKKLKELHDVDVRESTHGRTPVLTAIMFGQEGIARELLKAGANLEAKADLGVTAEMSRPEAYLRLRSEALANGWMEPEPGMSYGFIGCDESNLEMLRGFGVRTGCFDIDRQGVLVEVPPVALPQIASFPADFRPDLRPFDVHDDESMRIYRTVQASIAPEESTRSIWLAQIQASETQQDRKPRRAGPMSGVKHEGGRDNDAGL